MGQEAKPSLDQSHLVQLITQCHHPSSTTGAYSFRMNIANIAEQLAETGYIVLEKPLLANLSTRLLTRCQDNDPARFKAARIGRGRAKQQNNSIRGDVISWLDDTDSADHAYLAWMEQLRSGLNEALFLGLFDFECHYAIYGAGAGYAKHSDVLNGNKNRILSTVYYLNEGWQACDGGELVLFEPTGDTIIATVNPAFGTMIIFLSESFPHEVLMANTKRHSIAGWFRVREGA
jgi:SM-20-related protein